MKLVATPKPHPTECISGYLHTLSAANGYPRPSFLLTGLFPQSRQNAFRAITPPMLQEMTGMAAGTAKRVCVPQGRLGSRASVMLMEQGIHVSELRMDALRICPLCIREGGRHQAAWHLKLVNWCSKHRVRLLESCQECNKPLSWNRPTLGGCSCGADLTVQSPEVATCSESMRRLIQALEAALYRQPKKYPFPDEMGQLRHLDLYLLSRFILVLSEQVEEGPTVIVHGRRYERPITAEQLECIACALDDWPHNFRNFLKERYEQKVCQDQNGKGFRSAFGWAFETLKRNIGPVSARKLEFLRSEIYRFGAAYVSRERLVRGDRTKLPISNTWGSILEAAAVANLDPRTVLKRVKAGEIPAVEADYHRRNRNFLVDLDWLRKWKISRYERVDVRDAAATLDISVSLLQALRTAGIYHVNHHTSRLSGFSEEDVQAFCHILAGLSELYSSDGTPGAISYGGVTLRTTKSIPVRVDMMKVLMAKHPHLWEQAYGIAGTSDSGRVEMEVSGHMPVIVENEPTGLGGLGLVALLPSGNSVRKARSDEMAIELQGRGYALSDVIFVDADDRAVSEKRKQDFKEAWKRLEELL